MEQDYGIDKSNVTILIPTLNEEKTIGTVVSGFTRQGFKNILVIDGKSTDNTQTIASKEGAKVITQESNGKGAAVKEALNHIDTEYTVMIDGDSTYDPSEIDSLLHEIARPTVDEVIGNRFANIQTGAMDTLHQFGNKLINIFFFLLLGTNKKDILSGYRVYETDTLRNLDITSQRFGIETELCTKTALQSYTTSIVPITYYPRPDGSEANLSSFDDGLDIIKTLLWLRFSNR